MTDIEEIRNHPKVAAKKMESDAALIDSLHRYISALEGKAKMLEEKNQELTERLETLMAAYEWKQ